MREEKISGLMVYYYHVCKKKLWLHGNHISMESENGDVQMGKILDDNTYTSKRKHILINDEINLDFVEKTGVIHEIKKSRVIEEASIWQVKYYLYYLQKLGIEKVRAKIDYPLLKEVVEIECSSEDSRHIEKMIEEIKKIMLSASSPMIEKKPLCKKCAFFDLCMI